MEAAYLENEGVQVSNASVDVDNLIPKEVLIPNDAVGASSGDYGRPTVDLLRRLNLLPLKGELQKADGVGGAIAGPPDSVAVIEAGLTAGSKFWSLLIGASSTAAAGAVLKFWNQLGEANQPAALLALGFALGVGSIGIAYILGSDVRGRSAAMVATIEARAGIAIATLEQSQRSTVAADHSATDPIALAGVLGATRTDGTDDPGWKVIAAQRRGGAVEYLLIKGATSEWIDAKNVKFA